MGVSDNEQLTCSKFVYILKQSGLLMSNLMFVYFFEYSITTSFGIAAVDKLCYENPICVRDGPEAQYIYVEAFTIMYFCYQVGVFISRSSLQFMVIDKVWVISLLQLGNFLFFLLNAFYVWMDSLYLYFFLNIWVGLMGGASYVNVIYKLQRTPKLKRTERELAIMIMMVFNDVGIFSASLLALILSTTVFSQYN